MSQAIIKLQRKGQLVIPRSLREEAGVLEGTLMKIAVVEGGQFLLTPQLTIDRSLIASPRKSHKELLQELGRTVAQLRLESVEKGIDKMSVREVKAAVSQARRVPKNAGRRPAK